MPECDDNVDEFEVEEKFTDFENKINHRIDTDLDKDPLAEYIDVYDNDRLEKEIEQSSSG